jgi:hypothetical protein
MEAQLDVRKSTFDALHSLNNFFFIARVYERSFESESRRCQNDFFGMSCTSSHDEGKQTRYLLALALSADHSMTYDKRQCRYDVTDLEYSSRQSLTVSGTCI